jgi:uncharacterized membrane protein
VIALKREYGFRPQRLFLLIGPLLYFAYALLTPPFQTPDEHQHLFRAWQLSQFQLFGERLGNAAGGVLPGSLGDAALPEIGSLKPHLDRPLVKRPASEAFSRATPVAPGTHDRFYDFRGATIYSPASYAPQIIAIWIGKAGGLSVENIIRLGRMLNAALAIFLIYWALRLTPVGASALLFVALLPMTAASSASFGQDGLIIGGACLLTAAGLRNLFAREPKFSSLAISAAVAIPLALCKIFYLPLALIGGQPFVGGKFQARRLWPWMAASALAAALAIVWFRANAAAVVAPWPGIPAAGARLAEALRHPLEFPSVLEHTYVDHGPVLLDTLFEFGWLNVPSGGVSAFLCAVACGLVLIAGDTAAAGLKWQTRAWLIGSAMASALLVSVAAWIYGTPAGMDSIFGLQGRYFIPLIAPLLIALLPRRAAPSALARFIPVLMIAANASALVAIVSAFYSF